ncbi:NAD(P)-dependent alcohol dehydrogenase [Microbacterium deminutum]|uniref:NAD(P)-dependent alcohol dehydrogenase n=1 Tax=Microbacterium deminutum TaxID=344164 RepID=UPI0031D76B00
MASTMKAVVYDRYGPPDVLRLEDVPVPVPGPREVLVEVAATSLNLSDWEALVGSPAYARFGGLRRPRRRILGSDIAGVVAAVGPGVTRFATGDEVFGDNLQRLGGFAQFAIASESALAVKPAALTFAQASAIPQSGEIAAQGTVDVTAGTRMLINGAGGGSGAFAIPLAKAAGAHVTGVDNAGKLAFMRALGADAVIDYRAEDFTRTGPYDLILDLVAHRSVFAYRRALAPGGRYRAVGGRVRALVRILTVGTVIAGVSGRRMGILVVRSGPAQFEPLAQRCAQGEIDIHIDRTFALHQTAEALAYLGEGRALGKVIVQP